MADNSELDVFRDQARCRQNVERWIDVDGQEPLLKALAQDINHACRAGLRPVVCVDLDLTTLLVPAKSTEVLAQLASLAEQLPVAPARAALKALLARIWRGEEQALLPGYTSTAIKAYGAFLTCCLEARSGMPLAEDRDPCEAWIASQVHGLLRSGYWDRDAAQDEFSPGFAAYAASLVDAGGTIVFLSNRDPSLRDVSLRSLSGLLDDAAPVFAFFGPGGSQFDASSKAAAVALLEQGVGSGVYFGRAVGGATVYDIGHGGFDSGSSQAIVAVIDDRSENRRQILAAATASAERLMNHGLRSPRSIACAAPGFCPEIEIVSSADAIGSFEIGTR